MIDEIIIVILAFIVNMVELIEVIDKPSKIDNQYLALIHKIRLKQFLTTTTSSSRQTKTTTVKSRINNLIINYYNDDNLNIDDNQYQQQQQHLQHLEQHLTTKSNNINEHYGSILSIEISGNFKVWHLVIILMALWIITGKYIIYKYKLRNFHFSYFIVAILFYTVHGIKECIRKNKYNKNKNEEEKSMLSSTVTETNVVVV